MVGSRPRVLASTAAAGGRCEGRPGQTPFRQWCACARISAWWWRVRPRGPWIVASSTSVRLQLSSALSGPTHAGPELLRSETRRELFMKSFINGAQEWMCPNVTPNCASVVPGRRAGSYAIRPPRSGPSPRGAAAETAPDRGEGDVGGDHTDAPGGRLAHRKQVGFRATCAAAGETAGAKRRRGIAGHHQVAITGTTRRSLVVRDPRGWRCRRGRPGEGDRLAGVGTDTAVDHGRESARRTRAGRRCRRAGRRPGSGLPMPERSALEAGMGIHWAPRWQVDLARSPCP